jgi:signal transduction histidine kinase
MGRIALELGPIGFLFWYGLRISLVIALFWTYWNVKSQFLRQLALTAFLIQAILFNGQLVFHHTFSVYYWFFSSFIFLLPRLEEIENWQREQQLLEEDVLSPYLPDSPYR